MKPIQKIILKETRVLTDAEMKNISGGDINDDFYESCGKTPTSKCDTPTGKPCKTDKGTTGRCDFSETTMDGSVDSGGGYVTVYICKCI